MKKVFNVIYENDFATFVASWVVTYITFFFICDVQLNEIWDFTILFLVIGWPIAILFVPIVTAIADLGSR